MLHDLLTSEYIKTKNSAILDQLTYAFYQVSIVDVKKLLHDKGTFCGVSKDIYLSRLNKKFNEILDTNFGVALTKGIALNQIPGAEVLEFRFLTGLAEDEYYNAPPKSFGSKCEKDEILFRLCVEFSEGKIIKIEYPTRFIKGGDLLIPQTFHSIN